MSSRITVFDRSGSHLAEITASYICAWVHNDVGRGEFDLAMTDPNVSSTILNFGNFVLIEHDKLPPWIGVIDTPRTWRVGVVTVSIFSAEKLLLWRIGSSHRILEGPAGEIFRQILAEVNQAETTILSEGEIYTGSQTRQETISPLNAFLQDCQRIALRADHSFSIRPQRVESRLSLQADWKERSLEVCPITLEEFFNIEELTDILTEEGDIYNQIAGVGEGSSWTTRSQYWATDEVSRDTYGLRQKGAQLQAATPSGVEADAKSLLAESARPRMVVGVTALDKGDLFSYLRLDMIVNVKLKSVGFSGGGDFGYEFQARIEGMSYDVDQNKVELVIKEL